MSENTGSRLLGMNFQSGIKYLHVWTFFSLCWAGIMLLSFLPTSQAYLFTEFLDVPTEDHGKLGGDLAFFGEIVFLLVAGLWGALSDKIGRRKIMAFAFAFMAIGLLFYSRADSVSDLYWGRLIFALGSAAYSVMILAIVADYALDDSRGKLTGWLGVFNGLGAVAALLFFAKLPQIMVDRGMGPIEAGQFMYSVVIGITVIITIIAWFGLRKNEVIVTEHKSKFSETLIEGIRAGRKPRILLAYAAGFISRGNLTIVGTFFILWVSNHGSELGMDRAEAFARGGAIVAIAQSSALFAAPVFGILSDRLDRVTALMIALMFSAAGYCGTYFISDPFSLSMYACAALIGVGEVAVIITSAVLIAEEAPDKIRGAVIGFFTLCGALGIMVAAKMGGYLFDGWKPAAPFILFGVFALVVCIWAMFLRPKKA